ncbi:U-box domain-containing protein 21-like [Musa acuminata AAA Group]|uniref:U-box domain-containing protein 21-like n=1 Tax=Musa acuminata AAA Group TaxID=214697 RepID=UPI0031DA772E
MVNIQMKSFDSPKPLQTSSHRSLFERFIPSPSRSALIRFAHSLPFPSLDLLLAAAAKLSLFMASPRRSRESNLKTNLALDVAIPTHFRCPISLDLMRDPVTASTGITYDRQSIETWQELGNTSCPVTGQQLQHQDLIPNHSIRKMIQDWCVAHRPYGIERIPTPTAPVNRAEVMDVLSEIATASRQGDVAACARSVAKVTNWAKESERNRRRLAFDGMTRVLAATFVAFARASSDVAVVRILEEVLAAMAMLLPLDEEAAACIGSSPESLKRLVSVLRCGDVAARLHAALTVKELLASGGARADAIAATKGMGEALVKLVKRPISSRAMKASLVSIFYMVNSDEKTATRIVDLGLIPVLVEILVDDEKSMCEKALAVLDGLLSCERGRENACGHALTVPVLAKKMFRVSDMATEFVVSALWKLCKDHKRGGRERCLLDALQVGTFHKLLLLLQVGCGEATKERVTDLLRLLNGYRGRIQCVDTMDFVGLKRPFE